MENTTLDGFIKAIQQIGPVVTLIFLFMYITFWKILPALQSKDTYIKELNDKFIASTDKFNVAIAEFTKTIHAIKDEIIDKLDTNSEKLREIHEVTKKLID